MNDLTIFLPLKGRHLHTLRWMWHADRVRIPYRVIVADGDVHPAIDRLLSDRKTFPNVDFKYYRYNDKAFSDFYRKCAESLARVETRYVMISDNDDFLFPAGIEKCISFLESSPDFVCAAGGIPGFDTEAREDRWNGVVGGIEKLKYRCHNDGSYDSRNLDAPSASERVLEQLSRYLSIYYSVYRADVLKTIMAELDELNFSDLLIHEFYGALRTLTLGKVSANPGYLSYFRQGNTSLRSSFNTDWVDHLLRSRFPQDFQAMSNRIVDAAVPDGGEAASELRTGIHERFAAYMRNMLAGTIMRHRLPRLFGVKQKLLLARDALSPAWSLRRAGQERAFWRRLAEHGADQTTIMYHRKEMAEIEETLAGGAFMTFVAQAAPDLLASDSTVIAKKNVGQDVRSVAGGLS